MDLYLGQHGITGRDIQRYARQHRLLELPTDSDRLPKPSRLETWAEAVPAGFVFSLVLPRAVSSLESVEPTALDRTLTAAGILQPRWVIVRTPATVRPTTANRSKLARLIDNVRTRLGSSNVELGWEAAGLWQEDETEAFAERLSVALVRDLRQTDVPPGPQVYTRLLAIGRMARVSQDAAAHLAQKLIGRESAFIIAEGAAVAQLGRLLRAELSLLREPEA